MDPAARLFCLGIAILFGLTGCMTKQPPVVTSVPPTNPVTRPTQIVIPPTPTETAIPQGETIVVSSADDSGPGTLRQALQDAQPGDTISFDPAAFPPKKPATVRLQSGLPPITQDYLTLDASNAGVILDGSQAGGDWTPGIEIASAHDTIRGLQVMHFTGPGILIDEEAGYNIVGGDRRKGNGPLGEGNMFSDTSDGIGIRGSDNVIAGNLVGTDVTGRGKMGNRAPGVFIEENASGNTIGPDNVIAYNGTVGGGGVEIRSWNAQANAITANSIHDNAFTGIYYNISEGQGKAPAAPVILGFDLAAGTADGLTCPGCAVEIFSTHKVDGEVYEGTATANPDGNFTFIKGEAFAGPSLTATSRPPQENTSAFSNPTAGARKSIVIQAQDSYPRLMLEAKPSAELDDNRIGQLFDKLYLNSGLQGIVDKEVAGEGTKYVKLTLTEAEAETDAGGNKEPVAWNVPEFSFTPEEEQFITSLADNGISVDYMLTFWDKADHPQGWQPAVSRFRTQEEIDHYLEYVRFIVDHFKGRVHSYEFWNEPDNRIPLQWIQPEDYINLVRQAAPVIRQEDPSARIVIGSTSGFRSPYAQEYLFKVLNSDVLPLVDVVAWHPLFSVSPAHFSSIYYAYPATVQKIKDTAAAHGFRGTYRADEITYRSPDCTWCDPGDPSDSNITAAKYLARGIVMNLGLDVGAGVGGSSSTRLEYYTVAKNLCTVLAGAQATSLPVQIDGGGTKLQSYGFSLANGDYLAAMWSDGVATDDDPGGAATITIDGYAGWKATGIDILNGIEQRMITSNENGNLVISGFQLKDYPMFILLSK